MKSYLVWGAPYILSSPLNLNIWIRLDPTKPVYKHIFRLSFNLDLSTYLLTPKAGHL